MTATMMVGFGIYAFKGPTTLYSDRKMFAIR